MLNQVATHWQPKSNLSWELLCQRLSANCNYHHQRADKAKLAPRQCVKHVSSLFLFFSSCTFNTSQRLASLKHRKALRGKSIYVVITETRARHAQYNHLNVRRLQRSHWWSGSRDSWHSKILCRRGCVTSSSQDCHLRECCLSILQRQARI